MSDMFLAFVVDLLLCDYRTANELLCVYCVRSEAVYSSKLLAFFAAVAAAPRRAAITTSLYELCYYSILAVLAFESTFGMLHYIVLELCCYIAVLWCYLHYEK